MLRKILEELQVRSLTEDMPLNEVIDDAMKKIEALLPERKPGGDSEYYKGYNFGFSQAIYQVKERLGLIKK